MKGLDYKGNSSELSMLVGGSTSSNMETDEPKLEDFLGGHSFSDHRQKLTAGFDNSEDYTFSNCSLQLPPPEVTSTATNNNNGNGNSNSSIGLSMIKTWLRNQPAPVSSTQQNHHGKNVDLISGSGVSVGVGVAHLHPNNAQSLSLSMSTGSQSISVLGVGGGGEGSSAMTDKQKGSSSDLSIADTHSGVTDAGARKSVDTFGQRTSIYRGVTRLERLICRLGWN